MHRVQKHIKWTAVRNYSGSVKKKTQTRIIRKRKTLYIYIYIDIGAELARWEINKAREVRQKRGGAW